MKEIRLQNKTISNVKSGISLLPIALVFFAVIVLAVVFLIVTDDTADANSRMYLLPWVLLTGTVIAAPSVYLWVKNEFSPINPIVFAAWSYFFPAFFLGGLIFTFNLSDPFFLNFIQDMKVDLPLTFIVIMLGYGGLSVGFLIPWARKLGVKIGNFMPQLGWKSDNVFFPGFVLLALGLFNTAIGYIAGVIGYQKLEEIGTYDGLLFLLTLIWSQANLLLWLLLFRRKKLDFWAGLTAIVLLLTALPKVLYGGNRAGFLLFFLAIAFAYLLAGNKITIKKGIVGGILLVLSIIVGMIYGTTFRNIKGTESQTNMTEYTENILATVETISENDNVLLLENGFSSLVERIDAVSSLAVVVSNYEKLAPYEEGYGLDNNIYKDTVTFFIPRVIWQDKPVASEPRKYGDLYFNYGENSFTITPMGDLLRNFGLIGVPIGMLLLGFLLRIIYAALLEKREFSYWRATLYFMLVISVSYESFYGSILPYLTKVGFISAVGLATIHFLIKKEKKLIINEQN